MSPGAGHHGHLGDRSAPQCLLTAPPPRLTSVLAAYSHHRVLIVSARCRFRGDAGARRRFRSSATVPDPRIAPSQRIGWRVLAGCVIGPVSWLDPAPFWCGAVSFNVASCQLLVLGPCCCTSSANPRRHMIPDAAHCSLPWGSYGTSVWARRGGLVPFVSILEASRWGDLFRRG